MPDIGLLESTSGSSAQLRSGIVILGLVGLVRYCTSPATIAARMAALAYRALSRAHSYLSHFMTNSTPQCSIWRVREDPKYGLRFFIQNGGQTIDVSKVLNSIQVFANSQIMLKFVSILCMYITAYSSVDPCVSFFIACQAAKCVRLATCLLSHRCHVNGNVTCHIVLTQFPLSICITCDG